MLNKVTKTFLLSGILSALLTTVNGSFGMEASNKQLQFFVLALNSTDIINEVVNNHIDINNSYPLSPAYTANDTFSRTIINPGNPVNIQQEKYNLSKDLLTTLAGYQKDGRRVFVQKSSNEQLIKPIQEIIIEKTQAACQYEQNYRQRERIKQIDSISNAISNKDFAEEDNSSEKELKENEGLKKKITKKQEIRHIPTTGLYQYSPFHEQYRLLNKEGFLTDNIQPLEATLRGIIIKNENNTFDFQITAEQIKEVWTNTSKDLISIQITAEQFKILEQNQRANNPEKKTFVMVNDTNQAFVIDGIIKKSYFTKRNCALVTTALGLIAVVIYAMQKYNIRFSDLKISELFKNISLSSTTTA
ncbi:MAG TPA: hypothetical protein VKU36_05435 [Candidatus Babeliales bacterium]|nr:hypothetical protein [Candidatus Babeliales bacterium]